LQSLIETYLEYQLCSLCKDNTFISTTPEERTYEASWRDIQSMKTSFENLGFKIYQDIAENFPIVSASDEFYYFPQVQNKNPDWTVWDRFSPECISEFCTKLSLWEKHLENIIQETLPTEIVHLARIRILKKVLGPQI